MDRCAGMMKRDYCAVREGITQTVTEIITIQTDGYMARAAIHTYDSFEYHVSFIEWKMGKAEMHYRCRKRDKHAGRWVRRHRKKEVVPCVGSNGNADTQLDAGRLPE